VPDQPDINILEPNPDNPDNGSGEPDIPTDPDLTDPDLTDPDPQDPDAPDDIPDSGDAD
jgi:hypothetical protein